MTNLLNIINAQNAEKKVSAIKMLIILGMVASMKETPVVPNVESINPAEKRDQTFWTVMNTGAETEMINYVA